MVFYLIKTTQVGSGHVSLFSQLYNLVVALSRLVYNVALKWSRVFFLVLRPDVPDVAIVITSSNGFPDGRLQEASQTLQKVAQ